MKLKIKQLVAWIGGKAGAHLYATRHGYGRSDNGEDITTAPVSILGYTTVSLDYEHQRPLVYGKKKQAYPFRIDVTHASNEVFPLRLLLDIMDRAQAIREESWMNAGDDSGYQITKDDAADKAVNEILGVHYERLARFVSLTDHWWNDLEHLLDEMRAEERIAEGPSKARKRISRAIEIIEADRPD